VNRQGLSSLAGRPAISEAAWSAVVRDAAHHGGWLMTHFRPGRTDQGWRTALEGDPGWPDWIFCHPTLHRFVVAELKSQKGVWPPHEREWFDALAGAGVEVYLWRPSDWPQVESVLLGHVLGAQRKV